MNQIAFLIGGPGYEREVSLASFEYFKKYFPLPYDVYNLPDELQAFLEHAQSYRLVIPLIHGEWGEDGKIVSLLEMLGIPHLYSRSEVMMQCMNKHLCNMLVASMGIPVPEYSLSLATQIPFPRIIKPNHGGSSVGVKRVETFSEFFQAVTMLKTQIHDQVLIQSFIEGDEVSVSVVDGVALPILSIIKDPQEIFDYEMKYHHHPGVNEVFISLPSAHEIKLKEYSEQIYATLGCCDFIRVDYIIAGEQIYFLEVNTVPGMTETSILPQAWRRSGRTDSELMEFIANKLK